MHELRPDVEAAAGVIASVIFAAYALVALAGGLAVLLARRPETALRGLLASLLAVTGAYVQMMASAVAAVQLVALAGAAIAALRLVAGETEAGWQRKGLVAAGLVGLAGLALVLVGTWARQYVWTGRELAPGSSFGSAGALGMAWSEAHAPALVAALLALLVAAIVATAGREHRL